MTPPTRKVTTRRPVWMWKWWRPRQTPTSSYISDEPFYFMQARYAYNAFSPRQAFCTASLRGWHFAETHLGEIIDLILTQYSKKRSREHLQFEVDQTVPLLQHNRIEIDYMNPARWSDIAHTYASLGLLPAGGCADASENSRATAVLRLIRTLCRTGCGSMGSRSPARDAARCAAGSDRPPIAAHHSDQH